MSFFFQAEDGIRDYKVTGVQTCALPIFDQRFEQRLVLFLGAVAPDDRVGLEQLLCLLDEGQHLGVGRRRQIGRASCRERVSISEVAVSLEKKISDTS